MEASELPCKDAACAAHGRHGPWCYWADPPSAAGKVILFIDDDMLGRTEPQVFASIQAMIEWFKTERGYTFPDDEDDKLCIEALRRGESFASKAHYFGWHNIYGGRCAK